jgi:hypothetical protein
VVLEEITHRWPGSGSGQKFRIHAEP